jgi:hypothetical protein
MLILTNKLQRNTIFFIVVKAPHVSGGFPAHHQELKNCTCSIWYLLSLVAATDSGSSNVCVYVSYQSTYNVILMRVRVIIVIVEKNLVLLILCTCSVTYLADSVRALYYIVTCGLSDFFIFFHIIS